MIPHLAREQMAKTAAKIIEGEDLNLLIGSINRKGKTWIPRGQDTIQVGDTVIIVTTQKGLGDILDILRK